jgi:hypothetical protein
MFNGSCFASIMFHHSVFQVLSMTSIIFLDRWTEQDVYFVAHKQKDPAISKVFCRGGQIRTDDLLVPNQARYRATLHPENTVLPFCITDTGRSLSRFLIGTTPRNLMEARRYKKIFYLQLFFVIRQGIEPRTVRLEI